MVDRKTHTWTGRKFMYIQLTYQCQCCWFQWERSPLTLSSINADGGGLSQRHIPHSHRPRSEQNEVVERPGLQIVKELFLIRLSFYRFPGINFSDSACTLFLTQEVCCLTQGHNSSANDKHTGKANLLLQDCYTGTFLQTYIICNE